MANSRVCSVDGCGKPFKAHGLCYGHYKRWTRAGENFSRSPVLERRAPNPGALCAYEGCSRPSRAMGWCAPHYRRWKRHGDPSGGNVTRGEALSYLHDVVLSYEGSACLIWPYVRNFGGYGAVFVTGHTRIVSRYVCELLNGERPSDEHEAAHSCGNGHKGCVAPRHLSWKTRKENGEDKIRHGNSLRGEKSPKAKLTAADVREIRALRGTMTRLEIANRFGIKLPTLDGIYSGKNWGWLT